MKAKADFRVDVVIPAHNSEGTLEAALASVEKQTHAPQQVIVVADRCSDATAEIAKRRGARVVEVHFGRASLARNAGVDRSTAPWVAFLDADDLWLPPWLKSASTIAKASPGADLLFCTFEERESNGRLLRHSPRPTPGKDPAEALLLEPFVQTSATIVKRKTFLELGGFSPRFEIGEDLHLWLRLAFAGVVEEVPGRHVQYIRQPESLTRSRVFFARAVKDGLAVIDDICQAHPEMTAACEQARLRIHRDSALRYLSVGDKRTALAEIRRGLSRFPGERELWALLALTAIPGPWPGLARHMRRVLRRWRHIGIRS
jgi:glycosyltransferase involved in cell wall biosynthesis